MDFPFRLAGLGKSIYFKAKRASSVGATCGRSTSQNIGNCARVCCSKSVALCALTSRAHQKLHIARGAGFCTQAYQAPSGGQVMPGVMGLHVIRGAGIFLGGNWTSGSRARECPIAGPSWRLCKAESEQRVRKRRSAASGCDRATAVASLRQN